MFLGPFIFLASFILFSFFGGGGGGGGGGGYLSNSLAMLLLSITLPKHFLQKLSGAALKNASIVITEPP